MIYALTYIVFLFSSFYELTVNKRAIKTSFFLLILLFFIAIFRIDTGTDYSTYYNFWENIDLFDPNKSGSYGYVEIGFRLFISILKIFTETDFIYFTFLAAIPLFFLYKTIVNFKLYPVTALIFYYCFFYFAFLFNAIGQAITISVMLYSIKFILEKNFKYVLFICLITSLIHISGIVILILYFLMNYKFSSKKNYLFSIFFGMIFYKLKLVNTILEFIFPGKFNVYYEFFVNESSAFEIITKIAIFSIFFIFSFKIKTELYQKIFQSYSFGILMFLALLDQNMLGTRIFMLFKPLEIFMILLILSYCKNIFTRISIFSVFLIPYTVQFYININNPDFFYNFRF